MPKSPFVFLHFVVIITNMRKVPQVPEIMLKLTNKLEQLGFSVNNGSIGNIKKNYTQHVMYSLAPFINFYVPGLYDIEIFWPKEKEIKKYFLKKNSVNNTVELPIKQHQLMEKKIYRSGYSKEFKKYIELKAKPAFKKFNSLVNNFNKKEKLGKNEKLSLSFYPNYSIQLTFGQKYFNPKSKEFLSTKECQKIHEKLKKLIVKFTNYLDSEKQISILFSNTILQKIGFRIKTISTGCIDKNDSSLIPPCIIVVFKGQPKIRFNNEKSFLNKYYQKINKASINQMTSREYFNYIILSKKNGETKKYREWRILNVEKINQLKKIIDKYNKTRRNISIYKKISYLEFDDGTLRIGIKIHNDDKAFLKMQKESLKNKRSIYQKMLSEFNLFAIYLRIK